MSRDIKFRQAIAATAEVPFYWHYWGYLKSDSAGIPMFTGPIGIMSRDKRQSYQFTGLRDKNGKNEIYHKDILDWDDNRFVVEWDNDNGLWYGRPVAGNKERGILSGIAFGNTVKNGNIHENPDLLETK